jgi:hypothetical protein
MKVAKFRRYLGLIIRLFFNNKKKFQNRKKGSQCISDDIGLPCGLLLLYDKGQIPHVTIDRTKQSPKTRLAMLAEAVVMLEEESALTSAEAAAILANISSGRVLRISNTSALFLQKQEMFLTS